MIYNNPSQWAEADMVPFSPQGEARSAKVEDKSSCATFSKWLTPIIGITAHRVHT